MNIRFKRAVSPSTTLRDGETPSPEPKKKSKTKKFLLLGLGAVLFVALIAVLAYTAYFAFIKTDANVQITNVLPNSATVVWVSDYSEPGVALAFKGDAPSYYVGRVGDFEVGFDDRDYAAAEIEAAINTEQSATRKGNDMEAKDLDLNVKVKKMGRYNVHHATFRNLDPNTEYEVLIGDGNMFKGVKGEEELTFTTRPIDEEFDVPNPAYGTIVYEDTVSPSDGFISMYVRDANGDQMSDVITTPLGVNGTWYVDMTSLYSLNGERFFDNVYDAGFSEMEQVINVYTAHGLYEVYNNPSEDAPAPIIILDEKNQIESRTPSGIAFLSTISNDTYAICCKGGSCKTGETYGGDSNAPQSSCGQRRKEACGEDNVGGGGGSCDNNEDPPPQEPPPDPPPPGSGGGGSKSCGSTAHNACGAINYDCRGSSSDDCYRRCIDGNWSSGAGCGQSGDGNKPPGEDPDPPGDTRCPNQVYCGGCEKGCVSYDKLGSGCDDYLKRTYPNGCSDGGGGGTPPPSPPPAEARGACCRDTSGKKHWAGANTTSKECKMMDADFSYSGQTTEASCQGGGTPPPAPPADSKGRCCYISTKWTWRPDAVGCPGGSGGNPKGTNDKSCDALNKPPTTKYVCCVKDDKSNWTTEAACKEQESADWSIDGNSRDDEACDRNHKTPAPPTGGERSSYCCRSAGGNYSWKTNEPESSCTYGGATVGGTIMTDYNNPDSCTDQNYKQPPVNTKTSVCCKKVNGTPPAIWYSWTRVNDVPADYCEKTGRIRDTSKEGENQCKGTSAPQGDVPPPPTTDPDDDPTSPVFTCAQIAERSDSLYCDSNCGGCTPCTKYKKGNDGKMAYYCPKDDPEKRLSKSCEELERLETGGYCDSKCDGCTPCTPIGYDKNGKNLYQCPNKEEDEKPPEQPKPLNPVDHGSKTCEDIAKLNPKLHCDSNCSGTPDCTDCVFVSGTNDKDLYSCNARSSDPGPKPSDKTYDTMGECQNSCNVTDSWNKDVWVGSCSVRLEEEGLYSTNNSTGQNSDVYQKYCQSNDDYTCQGNMSDSHFTVYYRKGHCSYSQKQSSLEVKNTLIGSIRDLILPVGAQEGPGEDQILYSPEEGSYFIGEEGKYTLFYEGQLYEVLLETSNAVYILYIDDGDGVFDPEKDTVVAEDPALLSFSRTSSAQSYSIHQGFNFISFNFVPDEAGSLASDFLVHLNEQFEDEDGSFYSIATYDSGSWKIVGVRGGQEYGADDFQIVPGRGYLLRSKYDLELGLSGYKIEDPVPVSFTEGWNLVALHGATTDHTAVSWLDSIDETGNLDADNVTRWDTTRAKYDGLQKEVDSSGAEQVYGFDFPIMDQSAYFVRVVSGSGRWTPE